MPAPPELRTPLTVFLFPEVERFSVRLLIDRDLWREFEPLIFMRLHRVVNKCILLAILFFSHTLAIYMANGYQVVRVYRAVVRQMGVTPSTQLDPWSWMWMLVPVTIYAVMLMRVCRMLMALLTTHPHALGCRRRCKVGSVLTIPLLGALFLAALAPKISMFINNISPFILGVEEELLPVKRLAALGQRVFDSVSLLAAILYRLITCVHERKQFQEYCRFLGLTFSRSASFFYFDMILEMVSMWAISYYSDNWFIIPALILVCDVLRLPQSKGTEAEEDSEEE